MKKFFDTHNKLNKGYRKIENFSNGFSYASPNNGCDFNKIIKTPKDTDEEYEFSMEKLLPSKEVIALYEEFSPGITTRIISMAAKDQAHKHHRDIMFAKNIKIIASRAIIGLTLNITFISLFSLAIVYFSNPIYAIIFAMFALALVFIMHKNFCMQLNRSYLSSHNKSFENRKSYAKDAFKSKNGKTDNFDKKQQHFTHTISHKRDGHRWRNKRRQGEFMQRKGA